jgi:transposase
LSTPIRQRTASVFLHLRHPNLPSPSVFINSVGIEATGSVHWFLELTGKLGVDHQVGHPSEIRKAEPRKQKYDRRDAALLLKLQVENRFPSIWMPSTELRDLRTLLKHRHQWVRMRTRVQNPLQAIALRRGLRPPPTAYRRTELQGLYHKLRAQIDELDKRVGEQTLQRPGAKLLMTHPGVGPVTALASDVFLGDPAQFEDGNALASYVGMIPSEYSSGGGQQAQKGLAKARVATARSGSVCGSCCATRSITKSSVAAAKCGRKTGVPVRRCQKWVIVLQRCDCETD